MFTVIDVETTGVDATVNSPIEIAGMDFTNPENQFVCEFRPFEGAVINDYSLTFNGADKEALYLRPVSFKEGIAKLDKWLGSVKVLVVAGENPHFDDDMLRASFKRAGIAYPFGYRLVDLHSMMVATLMRKGLLPPTEDRKLPLNSDKIMDVLGLPAEAKPHKALNGVRIEAEAFSRLIYGKNLLPEFREYPVLTLDELKLT
jgi:DNA polymerase III epsilon subunit-like protein